MNSRLDEFKDFVKKHPLLKDEVKNKRNTWQNIYEEWYLDDRQSVWDKYKNSGESKEETKNKKEEGSDDVKLPVNDELIKGIMGYVKKVNPDTINKSIDSIQKVIGLVTGLQGKNVGTNATAKKTLDPLFDRRFDDWY